jgi:ribosomal-protein-alanine N-acetyltransferase
MILATARLRLRPLETGDAAALFAILGDPAAMAFWDRGPLPRLATVEALLADELAAMAAGGFFAWAVEQEGDVIGSIDLSAIGAGQAWTGFLFRRDVWGQGLAREALTAVIEEVFGRLGLERLSARIQAANIRAARLLEQCGFQREGALPDVRREDGPRPCLRYGLVRSASAKGR